MIGFARHLNDDRLVECYFTARQGDELRPRAAAHLAACTGCAARYAEFAALFDVTRAEADAETDELFTTPRLRHQREQILRRLEHIDRPARVISFPARDGRRKIGVPGIAPRWLGAAAAAGLLVGVAVGGRFVSSTRGSAPAMQVVSDQSASARLAPAPAVLVNSPAVDADVIDDDAFLKELEFALERLQTRELEPFDALTPRVQEIGTRLQ